MLPDVFTSFFKSSALTKLDSTCRVVWCGVVRCRVVKTLLVQCVILLFSLSFVMCYEAVFYHVLRHHVAW
jgi:hypothetical protein